MHAETPTTDLRLAHLRRTYEPAPTRARPAPRIRWERALTARYWLEAVIVSIAAAAVAGSVASWLGTPVLLAVLAVMLIGGLGERR